MYSINENNFGVIMQIPKKGNKKEEKKKNRMNMNFFLKAKSFTERIDCSIFSEKLREEIFQHFWQMSWDQKKLYDTSSVEVFAKKRTELKKML